MQTLGHSTFRTQNSDIGQQEFKDNVQGYLKAREIQFKNTIGWVKKILINPNIRQSRVDKIEGQCGYFMVKIEGISNILYRKVSNQSQVYLRLNASLVNRMTGQLYPKSVTSHKILVEGNSSIFQLKQPLCYYFYTFHEANIFLRLELSVCELQTKESGFSSYNQPENIGYVQIQISKDRKPKQKRKIIPPNQYIPFSKQSSKQIQRTYGAVIVTVTHSEIYKILKQVICPDTLCDSTDNIAGIMGSFLPASDNTLTDLALSMTSRQLKLSFISIQIPANVFKDVSQKGGLAVKQHYLSGVTLNPTFQIFMRVSFHNGWKTVSEDQAILSDKGEVRIHTNQSNISDTYTKKSNVKLKQDQKKGNFIKQLTCSKNISLNLIFPQQQDCALIFQIIAKINCKYETNGEIINQSIYVPICFSILPAKNMNQIKSSKLEMLSGDAYSPQSLREMVKKVVKAIQIQRTKTEKLMEATKVPTQRDLDAISIARSIRTFANKSMKPDVLTIPKNQNGQIQFQVEIMERQIQPMNSFVFENLSNNNISKVNTREKINNQKQRIARDKKRVSLMQTKNRFQFLNRAQLVGNSDWAKKIDKVSEKTKMHQKKIFFSFLEEQLKKYYPSFDIYRISTETAQSKKSILSENKKIFYNLKISSHTSNLLYSNEHFSHYYSILSSNRSSSSVSNYFQYQPLPEDIARTELSQINFNNCFFFNFLSIQPNQHNPVCPRDFFFVFQLYNTPLLRSELMTIQKDSGQIVLSKKHPLGEAAKIMHVEMQWKEEPQNYQLLFLEFIQYLYNGILTIRMIDYQSGLQFGVATVPLRNLIRKHRNQAIQDFDQPIYHKHLCRGRLQLQIRNIRSTKQKPIKAGPSLMQSTLKNLLQNNVQKASEDQRILQRIKKYKDQQSKLRSRFRQRSPSKQQASIQGQLKLAKVINQKYVQQNKTIHVNYLRKVYFFIGVQNKLNTTGHFRVEFKDQQQKWIQINPLTKSRQQLQVIGDVTSLQPQEYMLLRMPKSHSIKLQKCLKINSNQQFQLKGNEKGFILMRYFSVRRFKQWSEDQNEHHSQDDISHLKAIFNHQRSINICILNAKTQTIQAIHAVQIVPQPDRPSLQFTYHRPLQHASVISLPFISPDYLQQQVDQSLSRCPNLILRSSVKNFQQTNMDKLNSSSQSAVMIQTNSVKNHQEIDFLVLNNRSQQKVSNSQKPLKLEKSKSRKLIENIVSKAHGPRLIDIKLKIYGSEYVSIKTQLWAQIQDQIYLKQSIFQKTSIKYFFALCDDEKTLKFNKSVSNQQSKVLKYREDQKMYLKYELISSYIGLNYIQIHFIEAAELMAQNEAFQQADFKFKQVTPFYKLLIEVETIVPRLDEVTKININKASGEKTISQPFTVRNPAGKKTEFKVLSSNNELAWVKTGDSNFQLDVRADKKITINFNSQIILRQWNRCGSGQGVIIGLKWDRGIQYFGFRFNIY